MRNPLRDHCRSLFTRLGLIMLITVIVITVASAWLFLRLLHGGDTTFHRHLVQYAEFLAREVGSPPDQDRAARLADRLHMRIHSQGGPVWSVGALSEPFPEGRLRAWLRTPTVQAEKFHGYQRVRVLQSDGSTLVFDILPTAQERDLFKRLVWQSLAVTGLAMLAAYAVARWLLQPVRWLTESAAAIRDGDLARRAPEKRGGELLDLSRTFNQMAASLERLLEAQRRLLLDVSHELRTPVTRMKLQLELLPDQSRTESMREDLRDMEAMIADILEAARLRHEAGALCLVETDLVVLLREVVARHGDRPPGVTARFPDAPVPAVADVEKIATVARNLLDNAWKYSQSSNRPVELTLTSPGDRAVITVRDHGVGVSAQALPHLFQPFYRADASRARATGGFGLGLSLCQAIVQAHGGRIAIESVEGQGTTVTVELPRTA